MRLPSSSSLLLATLAVSSSSSSLSALAAPVGDPASSASPATKSVASSVSTTTMSATPAASSATTMNDSDSIPPSAMSSHGETSDAQGDLEARGLNLADPLRPLPVVGDPLAALMTELGFGPSDDDDSGDTSQAQALIEQAASGPMHAAIVDALGQAAVDAAAAAPSFVPSLAASSGTPSAPQRRRPANPDQPYSPLPSPWSPSPTTVARPNTTTMPASASMGASETSSASMS